MKIIWMLALAVFCSTAPCAADTVAGVPGHVLIMRTGGNALIIWDATPEVAAIVSEKTALAAANLRLERKALRVLAQVAPKLERTAASATVRVTYEESGDVSPVYGTLIFAGVERYATLSISSRDIRSDRDRWKELGLASALPNWIDFKVVGRLPPR